MALPLKKLKNTFIASTLGVAATVGAALTPLPADAGDGRIEYQNYSDQNDLTVQTAAAKFSKGKIAISAVGADDAMLSGLRGVAEYIEANRDEDVYIVRGRSDAPKATFKVYYDTSLVGTIEASGKADVAAIQKEVFKATEHGRDVVVSSLGNDTVKPAQN